MNEHTINTTDTRQELPILENGGRSGRRGPLVVDLSGFEELDVISLSVLLTAQQKAEQEGRDVWLAGVPVHLWQALRGLGLGQFFKPFPMAQGVSV